MGLPKPGIFSVRVAERSALAPHTAQGPSPILDSVINPWPAAVVPPVPEMQRAAQHRRRVVCE